MKLRTTAFIFFLFLLSVHGLLAQPGKSGDLIIPLEPNRSVLFGKDIVIKDSSNQKQRQIAICSAFNGWLYAAYASFYSTQATIIIMKSIDNGVTWTKIAGGATYPYQNISSLDIAVSGDSISNLKLFLGFEGLSGSSQDGEVSLLRYNGETGIYENSLLYDYWSNGIALSSDEMYPATNSNPRSIGVIYTKLSVSGDSLIFCSSGNGGMSLNNRRAFHVSGPGKHFRKVALSYGRSFSKNSGRYYAAWEEKASVSSNTGHIYSAHSEPNVNGPFTIAVKLDSIDASANGNARNPVISCQYNNIDNDSSNLTEIVLFDKYIPATNKYGIEGFYNMTSTNTHHFKQFTLNSSSDNMMEPSVNFNPFDSKFMVTCYDSTNQKLPFLLNDFNMATPDNWQMVTSGYNESADLAAPFPKVAMNFDLHSGATVWIAEGTGGNGVALFDAVPNTWVGVPENSMNNGGMLMGTYPNPCTTEVTVGFVLTRSENVNITLYNILGRETKTLTDQEYIKGEHRVPFDLGGISPGCYLYIFRAGNYSKSGKITVL